MSDELEFALLRLADESRPVRAVSLATLSDLSRAQIEPFRETWAVLSSARRFELAQALVEQAESNVRYSFSAILRELLSDDDAHIRKLAIDGLWEDNRTSLVAPLIELIAGDPAAGGGSQSGSGDFSGPVRADG
jgi:hypothetical protein